MGAATMRYFIVFWSVNSVDLRGVGNCTFTSDRHLNRNSVEKYIEEKGGYDKGSVVLTGINELNEADYTEWENGS
jgi:hypothetical protein